MEHPQHSQGWPYQTLPLSPLWLTSHPALLLVLVELARLRRSSPVTVDTMTPPKRVQGGHTLVDLGLVLWNGLLHEARWLNPLVGLGSAPLQAS